MYLDHEAPVCQESDSEEEAVNTEATVSEVVKDVPQLEDLRQYTAPQVDLHFQQVHDTPVCQESDSEEKTEQLSNKIVLQCESCCFKTSRIKPSNASKKACC